jgi:hypothetical protein
MKKQIMLLSFAVLICTVSVSAQQGMQRLTPEERTKVTIEKLGPLALNADQSAKTTAVFTTFYNDQQKAMEEMRASGTMDREAMKAKRDEFAKKRDEALKAIFTAAQFKKWTEEVEPSLRPQPRPNNN